LVKVGAIAGKTGLAIRTPHQDASFLRTWKAGGKQTSAASNDSAQDWVKVGRKNQTTLNRFPPKLKQTFVVSTYRKARSSRLFCCKVVRKRLFSEYSELEESERAKYEAQATVQQKCGAVEAQKPLEKLSDPHRLWNLSDSRRPISISNLQEYLRRTFDKEGRTPGFTVLADMWREESRIPDGFVQFAQSLLRSGRKVGVC
jgi:hypothetical protein